jgi:hypothetical protein
MLGVSKKKIALLSLGLCMAIIFATAVNAFLVTKPPTYLVELPKSIAFIDNFLAERVDIYSDRPAANNEGLEVTFFFQREVMPFDEIVKRVVNPWSTYSAKTLGKVDYGGHKVNLIGLHEETLYIEVLWDEWLLNMQNRQDFDVYEPAFYDALILTLTSIPDIDQVQFMVSLNNRTGNLWEELYEPRSSENLFLHDGYVVSYKD